MTVVGKILVFLNLVFSLVVGGFAVLDYAARTNWARAYDDLKAQNQVIVGALNTYRDDAGRLNLEKDELYKALESKRVQFDKEGKEGKDSGVNVANRMLIALEERNRTIDDLRNQLTATRKERDDQKAEIAKALAIQNSMGTGTARRQEDTKILRDELAVAQNKLIEKEKQMNALRDVTQSAKIEADRFRDRNTQLEELLQEAQRQVAQLRAGGGAGANRGENPPPEDVEGKVLKVDGKYVTVSLGSDASLKKDQTLLVFRMGKDNAYLGTIKLVSVSAKESVGEFLKRPTKSVMVGDRVASRLFASK